MITKEKLDKMDQCRHLLDAPAPEVCGELIEEIRRLREALEKCREAIVQTIRHIPDSPLARPLVEAYESTRLLENAGAVARPPQMPDSTNDAPGG